MAVVGAVIVTVQVTTLGTLQVSTIGSTSGGTCGSTRNSKSAFKENFTKWKKHQLGCKGHN